MDRLEHNKMDSTSNNRIVFIDVARGIAILLVVIGHNVPMGYGVGQYIYSFHMPIFFIITGFLLFQSNSWKRLSAKEFIKKKAITLLYPYFTFSFLNIIIIMFTTGLSSAVHSIISTVVFDGILTLWFLPTLFLAEVFFYFFEKLSNKKYVILVLVVIITALFSHLEYQRFENRDISFILQLANEVNRSLIGLIYIYVGYAYGKVHSVLSTKRIPAYITGVFLFIFNVFLFRYNYVDLHYSIIGNPFLYYGNAIAGSYVLLLISERVLNKAGLLRFLGENSITIFATHLNFGIIGLSRSLLSAGAFFFPVLNSYSTFFIFIVTMSVEILIALFIREKLYFIINYSALRKVVHEK